MKLSVFDLDHTLIKVNASFAFGSYLFKQKHLNINDMFYCLAFYFMHKKFGLSMQKLHQKIFSRLFSGKNAVNMTFLVKKFLDHYFQEIVNRSVEKVLLEKQKNGEKIAILSSSPDFIVREIGSRFQVDFSVGTHYLVDRSEEFYTLSSVMDGEGKAQWVRELAQEQEISLDAVTAFTDSHLDLPLLETVGVAVVVNPDRKLLKISRLRGWQIIE